MVKTWHSKVRQLKKQSENEQTYQSTVIWLRIMNRQVAQIQTMAITVAGEVLPGLLKASPDKVPDKLRTKFGQPPFQDLAPGCKQPLPDNDAEMKFPQPCSLNLSALKSRQQSFVESCFQNHRCGCWTNYMYWNMIFPCPNKKSQTRNRVVQNT